MGMTLTEKIMARAAGRATVRPGEIVYPEADLATIHDLYVVEADTQLRALGVERPWNPDRVFVCFDHDIIPQSVAVANRAKNIRDIVRRWGVKHFYGPGRGQGHVFPMEIGLVRPGMCVQAYDIHVTNYGAVGCLGISLVFEFIAVLATGSHWYRVVYVSKVGNTIYVLHSFTKKSGSTSNKDVNTIKARYSAAQPNAGKKSNNGKKTKKLKK